MSTRLDCFIPSEAFGYGPCKVCIGYELRGCVVIPSRDAGRTYLLQSRGHPQTRNTCAIVNTAGSKCYIPPMGDGKSLFPGQHPTKKSGLLDLSPGRAQLVVTTRQDTNIFICGSWKTMRDGLKETQKLRCFHGEVSYLNRFIHTFVLYCHHSQQP